MGKPPPPFLLGQAKEKNLHMLLKARVHVVMKNWKIIAKFGMAYPICI